MINKDSVVTAYDEHLTLVEWLQKVETALDNAVLTNLGIAKLSDQGNIATYQVTATFADNTTIVSDTFTLPSTDIVTAFNGLTALVNGFDDRITDNTNNIARALFTPSSAPSTRKVVTIDTNGAQDNVDSTSLTTLMGNIVDSQGRKRFIEGTFTNLSSIEVTEKYNKWSLCGTHLMGVVAILIPAGTFKLSQLLFRMENFPDWLYDKLVAINATNPTSWGRVGYKKGMICNNDNAAYPAETSPFEWYKGNMGNHGIGFYIHGVSNEDITITQEKIIRVQFDFIVDSD